MENTINQMSQFIHNSLMEIENIEKTKRSKNKKQETILNLWVKFIKNNQAILVLLNNGFFEEIFPIHRLSMEHLFNIFALAKDDNFMEVFVNYSQKEHSKATKSLHGDLQKENFGSLTVENKTALDELTTNNSFDALQHLGYSIYNASQQSELASFYNNSYRIISINHAHSTFLSTMSKIKKEDVFSILENSRDFLKMLLIRCKEVFKSDASA
jgi:hypothetical protein